MLVNHGRLFIKDYRVGVAKDLVSKNGIEF